jgi:ketosteroid isomerase-like protein
MADPRILEIVRSTYAAFSRGDVDAVLEWLHPDVDWHPPPTSIDPQPLRGRDAVREYLSPNFFESQRAEPLEVTVEGNRVLVEAHVQARGAGSGVELDSMAWHLYVFRDEQVVRFEAHVDRDEAFAAFREPAP